MAGFSFEGDTTCTQGGVHVDVVTLSELRQLGLPEVRDKVIPFLFLWFGGKDVTTMGELFLDI